MNSNTGLKYSADEGDIKVTKEESGNGVHEQSPDGAPKEVPKRCEMEERRMEVNRMRAKQIRKRKKQMEEDMQKQIIQLTLENNKLRTQLKIQENEISLLRSQQINGSMFSHQQSFLPVDYSQNLLGAGNNALNMLSPRFNDQGLQQNNVSDLTQQLGFGSLPDNTSSSLAAQGSIASSENKPSFNQLGLGAFGNHQYSALSNNSSENHDLNEQTLAKLLSNSSPHDKQVIMQKLQSERNSARFI